MDKNEELTAAPTDNSDWERKMSQEEARTKGEALLAVIAELYTLIEWNEQEEVGDPFMKLTFYKSGRFTLENYNEEGVDEFTLADAEKQAEEQVEE